eukprot:scaffold16912_cov112-Isochrysis_galbana.AAC.2
MTWAGAKWLGWAAGSAAGGRRADVDDGTKGHEKGTLVSSSGEPWFMAGAWALGREQRPSCSRSKPRVNRSRAMPCCKAMQGCITRALLAHMYVVRVVC